MSAAPAETLELDVRETRPRGSWRPPWLTLPVLVGGLIVVAWIVIALTVPLWAPYGPLEQSTSNRLESPSAEHWMGTDNLGRDVFTRTLYGSRQSLPIAAIVIAVAVGLGSVVGAIAGFFGGWVDAVLMRVSDLTLAFPAILLAMTITASLGPGLQNALFAMVVVWWPVYARLLRAQIMSVKQLDHVTAAEALGASRTRVLLRHILPLSLTPILVNATMDFGQVVLLAASLSFIGLGALPPSAEWGAMISEGAAKLYQWWMAAGPGLAILTVVLGFNFVGDGLRDFLDPRTRAR